MGDGIPYLFVDAKVEKVREVDWSSLSAWVQRNCLVVGHDVHEIGRREIIGLDVGAAESERYWRDFLRGLVRRGPVGVNLAVSVAQRGPEGGKAR